MFTIERFLWVIVKIQLISLLRRARVKGLNNPSKRLATCWRRQGKKGLGYRGLTTESGIEHAIGKAEIRPLSLVSTCVSATGLTAILS